MVAAQGHWQQEPGSLRAGRAFSPLRLPGLASLQDENRAAGSSESHQHSSPRRQQRGLCSGKLCCRNPRKGGAASRARSQQGSQANPLRPRGKGREERPPEPGLTCGGEGG